MGTSNFIYAIQEKMANGWQTEDVEEIVFRSYLGFIDGFLFTLRKRVGSRRLDRLKSIMLSEPIRGNILEAELDYLEYFIWNKETSSSNSAHIEDYYLDIVSKVIVAQLDTIDNVNGNEKDFLNILKQGFVESDYRRNYFKTIQRNFYDSLIYFIDQRRKIILQYRSEETSVTQVTSDTLLLENHVVPILKALVRIQRVSVFYKEKNANEPTISSITKGSFTFNFDIPLVREVIEAIYYLCEPWRRDHARYLSEEKVLQERQVTLGKKAEIAALEGKTSVDKAHAAKVNAEAEYIRSVIEREKFQLEILRATTLESQRELSTQVAKRITPQLSERDVKLISIMIEDPIKVLTQPELPEILFPYLEEREMELNREND